MNEYQWGRESTVSIMSPFWIKICKGAHTHYFEKAHTTCIHNLILSVTTHSEVTFFFFIFIIGVIRITLCRALARTNLLIWRPYQGQITHDNLTLGKACGGCSSGGRADHLPTEPVMFWYLGPCAKVSLNRLLILNVLCMIGKKCIKSYSEVLCQCLSEWL